MKLAMLGLMPKFAPTEAKPAAKREFAPRPLTSNKAGIADYRLFHAWRP